MPNSSRWNSPLEIALWRARSRFALLPDSLVVRLRTRVAQLTRELESSLRSPPISRSHSLARSLVHSRSVLIVLMSDPVGHDSSVREVLAEVAEFSRQLVHHLLEDHRVDVLPWNCRERGSN